MNEKTKSADYAAAPDKKNKDGKTKKERNERWKVKREIEICNDNNINEIMRIEKEFKNISNISFDEKIQIEEEISIELLDKIRKQLEFYFGDVNLQRDKFLLDQMKVNGGWIPMTVLLNFKLLASMTKSTLTIAKALENNDLVEVSEDKRSLRRSLGKPLPEYNDNYVKEQERRTVYLRGFSAETTMEDLKKYFENSAVERITMRKQLKKKKISIFKGSIFVQFQTLDDAVLFMSQESAKYKDEELTKLWLCDYLQQKNRKSQIDAKKT